MTYDLIKSALTAKGYEFFEGDLNLNMVWERTNNIITNRFSDFLHIVYQQDGQNLILTIPATTKPGIRGAVDTPVTVDGVTGTAVIIPGQYKGSHEFMDEGQFIEDKSFPWNYPYFAQIKPLNYWRDNKSLTDIQQQEQDGKIYGTNLHLMSNLNTDGTGEVNNWSEGCMGSFWSAWNKILPVVRLSVAKYGRVFTQTIIESIDIPSA